MQDFAGLTGIVFALTQVIKGFGLSSRYVPVLVIFVGVGVSMLMKGITTVAIIEGLVASLTASGFYSSSKTLAGE